jgi:hypothetical protein
VPQTADGDDDGGPTDGGSPAGPDVDAAVAAAMEAVAKPELREVTDGDVLGALIEKGALTREALVQALALAELGPDAFNHPSRASDA